MRLETYADLLRHWTRRINLVAPATVDALWERHIADSAQLLPLAPPGATSWADLGSGAGLPGLVVAALRPGIAMTLVEGDGRKAAFLRTAARHMGLDVTVHAARIEAVPPLRPDVLTARALAPLPKLLDLAAPHLRPDTVCLFPKGLQAASELTAAAERWHSHVDQIPSRTDLSGRILRITGVRPLDGRP